MYMKILCGVPTRNRDVTTVVKALLAGKLTWPPVIVSSGSEVEYELYSRVEWLETNMQLGPARQRIVEEAMNRDCDVVIQSDDDLIIPPDTITTMLAILREYPIIGAVSAEASILNHWGKVETNKPFKIASHFSQLWAIRVRAIHWAETMFNGQPFFHLDSMEDIAASMKLWAIGFPVVRLNDPSLCIKPFITRHSKTGEMGGQPIEERQGMMEEAVSWLQNAVTGEGEPLSSCTLTRRKDGMYRYNPRYNWKVMTGNVVNRFGSLGYEDSKGRKM